MNRLIATLLLLAAAPLALADADDTPRFRLAEAQLRAEPLSADGRFRIGALRMVDRQPDAGVPPRFAIKATTPSKALCSPVPPPRIFGDGFENP